MSRKDKEGNLLGLAELETGTLRDGVHLGGGRCHYGRLARIPNVARNVLGSLLLMLSIKNRH